MMIQGCDITEVETDGRTQKVSPVIQDVLRSGNVVAEPWAVGFFLGDLEL